MGLNVARILQVRSIFGITPFARSLARPVLALGAASGLAVAARQLLRGPLGGGALPELVLVGAVFLAVYAAALAVLGSEPDDRVFWNVLVRSRRSRMTAEPT